MAERKQRGAKSGRRTPRSGTTGSSVSGASVRIKVPAVSKGPPWDVLFHPNAHKELRALKKRSEADYDAVVAVIEKLKVHGPALKFPHQSGVKGGAGKGLRELRPTGGRTLVRPLYRRFDNLYIILAIGPEATVDKTGFDNAVKWAQHQRKNIEDSN
jgi:hypothetical protein